MLLSDKYNEPLAKQALLEFPFEGFISKGCHFPKGLHCSLFCG